MIKFHILLRVGKPRNTEHMLTQFYKRDLHQNVDIREKMQKSWGKKKQIIYQKPGDCLKHLIINRSPQKYVCQGSRNPGAQTKFLYG